MGKLVIIFAVCFSLSLFLAVKDCSKQVEERGLKVIIEEIWEGKQ
jgi:hypothetical protein